MYNTSATYDALYIKWSFVHAIIGSTRTQPVVLQQSLNVYDMNPIQNYEMIQRTRATKAWNVCK